MFPLIGYVTRFEQQGDRFSASVDAPDDEDENEDSSKDIDTEDMDSDKTEGDELKQ
jgi:hypothetical protein